MTFTSSTKLTEGETNPENDSPHSPPHHRWKLSTARPVPTSQVKDTTPSLPRSRTRDPACCSRLWCLELFPLRLVSTYWPFQEPGWPTQGCSCWDFRWPSWGSSALSPPPLWCSGRLLPTWGTTSSPPRPCTKDCGRTVCRRARGRSNAKCLIHFCKYQVRLH